MQWLRTSFSGQGVWHFDMFQALELSFHLVHVHLSCICYWQNEPKPSYLAHEIWALCMVTSPNTTHSNVPTSHHVVNMYGKCRKGIYRIMGNMLRGAMMGWSCILEDRPEKCLQTCHEETVGKVVNSWLSDNQASIILIRPAKLPEKIYYFKVKFPMRVCSCATRQFSRLPIVGIVAPPVVLHRASALMFESVIALQYTYPKSFNLRSALSPKKTPTQQVKEQHILWNLYEFSHVTDKNPIRYTCRIKSSVLYSNWKIKINTET
jgi:hypothetical protein